MTQRRFARGVKQNQMRTYAYTPSRSKADFALLIRMEKKVSLPSTKPRLDASFRKRFSYAVPDWRGVTQRVTGTFTRRRALSRSPRTLVKIRRADSFRSE